ncbi:MAG: phosphotransferase, partial [Muribaculaceae bacterium]|nr:phosphotransferase [Muribaculaceae bacterium]
LTGNGGGFMFDCRGMHNPGRYDRYKPLTGLDKEVKDFLEEKGEVQEFIKASLDIVTPVIERYRSRGFNSLQVGFGCTGGRHRSVYCAQGFAEQVRCRFPDVRVELIHREQGVHTLYNKEIEK